MAEETSPDADARTPQQVMTQWRKFAELKRALVRDGKCDGDATPATVLATIRTLIPPDIFAGK